MILLTRKFTITPTKKQQKVLWELAETCRLLYNHALAERQFLYDSYTHSVTYIDQQNALPLLKTLFPRYQQVYSKVLQMTLKKLDGAYRAFFGLRKNGDETARPPTFRGRAYFFTLCYNQSGFQITKNRIGFSHRHPSKLPLEFSVPFDLTGHTVKQLEIFQDNLDKRFYLAVIYEQEEPLYTDNGLYQAFDLGTTKHTAVNLQGKFLESTVKRPDRYWEPKARSLQRRKDHCKQGSRRYCLFQQRLTTIKRKERNQTKDWQHKQSLNLLENTKANTIIIGDLSPRQMTKANKKISKGNKYQTSVNRGVHNTGHLGRFVELLTYKAMLIGKRVITIDERYTTKTCAVCGHQKRSLPLYQRIYSCGACETVLERDRNATINIMKRFLSQYALWTSYQYFLDQLGISGNLRHTINDKTKVSSHSPAMGLLVGSENS
jgi:putative transposase